jgi:hypothetical protein
MEEQQQMHITLLDIFRVKIRMKREEGGRIIRYVGFLLIITLIIM